MKPIHALAAACALSFALEPSVAIAASPVSSVWQVKSDTNTIYLAGAVPFLRESDLPLATQFRQAYQDSERLVFEVDPEESKDEREGQRTIMMGMYTDGGSIRDQVSEETYKKLGDFLSESGAPRIAMDRLRPWFAAVMISMTEMIKEGMRPDLGVGEMVERWAAEDGKPIGGLEGMRVELELLAGLPEEAHEHMLAESLEDVGDMGKLGEEFGKFIAAWRDGDIEGLEEIDSEDSDGEWDRLVEKKLYRGRAAEWMDEFEKTLAGEEPTMYVIGIAHLIGEGNLRAVLEERGYQVEQLKRKKGERKKQRKRDEKPALIPVHVSSGPQQVMAGFPLRPAL
ncbi:MAG: TraB/GumN family protein [Verrucomicrobiales bacterium]